MTIDFDRPVLLPTSEEVTDSEQTLALHHALVQLVHTTNDDDSTDVADTLVRLLSAQTDDDLAALQVASTFIAVTASAAREARL